MKVKISLLYFSVVILVFFIFQSCHNVNAPNTPKDTRSNIRKDSTAPIWGLFVDTIPCADCNGILTKLFLNKDFTFIKEENYIGAPDTQQHIFYDLGKWQIKDSIILLKDQMEASNNQYLLLPDGNIQMLAENGTTITDSLKTAYNFQMVGKSFRTSKPMLVSGLIERSANQSTLFICAWGKTQRLILSNAMHTQLDSLWRKLGNASASKAILQAEVTIDEHTDNQLYVNKLINLMNGENCN